MLENPVFRCFAGFFIGCLLILTLSLLNRWRHARAVARRWRGKPILPALFLLLMPLALLAGGGCASSGMIRASEVDYTFRRVAERHDAYVNGDANLPPLAKTVALQQTAALRSTLDQAKKTATTLPAK